MHTLCSSYYLGLKQQHFITRAAYSEFSTQSDQGSISSQSWSTVLTLINLQFYLLSSGFPSTKLEAYIFILPTVGLIPILWMRRYSSPFCFIKCPSTLAVPLTFAVNKSKITSKQNINTSYYYLCLLCTIITCFVIIVKVIIQYKIRICLYENMNCLSINTFYGLKVKTLMVIIALIKREKTTK